VAVVVAIVAVVFRSAWLPGGSAPAAAAVLQLAVDSEDNGLISLRWNGQSLPVAQAREGRLWIVEDQKPPRQVPLKAGQLAAGHLFYESSSDRVEFQLEVVEKSGAVVRESTIAAKKPAPTSAAPVENPQQIAAANPTAQNPAENPPADDAPKPVQPVRAFTPPPVPVARERAGEGNVILMEPAPALIAGSAAPAGTILPERVNIIPPPPAAASKPANTPAPTPQRVQVGGKLQSAMLLRKIDPAYPPIARQMRIQGTVRFRAVIGKEGDVRDLQFVSGPRALEKAAADAVKRWVYRPTLLNGHPVEVSTEIEISFSLD
jgi:protein TonB